MADLQLQLSYEAGWSSIHAVCTVPESDDSSVVIYDELLPLLSATSVLAQWVKIWAALVRQEGGG